MKQVLSSFLATPLAVALTAVPVFANEPGGGYEGISAMYYTLIGVILAYGAYDIFFKKS